MFLKKILALFSLLYCFALHSQDIDKIYHLPSFDHGGGLFHNFMNVVGFLDYCEEYKIINYRVDFEEQGHYYDQLLGPNWWEYYFQPICHESRLVKLLRPLKRTTKRVTSDKMAKFVHKVEFKLTKERAHEIINKYIKIKPYIENEVSSFVEKNFNNHFVIGVHFRETDKVKTMKGFAQHESPSVEYSIVFSTIDNIVNERKLKKYKVFVATDSAAFLQAIKNHYPEEVIFVNAVRSTDGKPLHYNVKTKDPHYYYNQGKEAVIDCLLLSKSNLMIKTSSNLNLCSQFFNPQLEVISLSERY